MNAKARANAQLQEMAAQGVKGTNAYQDLQSKRDQLDQMIALLSAMPCL